MNLLSLLNQLAAADASEQPTARRGALSQLARTAAATLPLALGAVAQPAVAQRAGTQLDALLLLLQVEWLQDEFYSRVLGTTPVSPPVSAALVPAAIQPDLTLIRAQQRQHIVQFEALVASSGGVLPARPRYDFTGSRGGAQAAAFADVFSNTDTMLAVAQTLEDLAVRAYLGQMVLLQSNDALLTLATRGLATEGRHAAHLRQLRRQRGASVKHWVSGTDNGGPVPPTTAPVYAGEDRTRQLVTVTREVDLSTLTPLLPITPALTDAEKRAAATEAIDEPLTASAVQAVVALFTA
ncbi:ferritin-like domain-containing protein [Hymenobacter latericus]|uniref:ferritin-like domain-containing protein n=1 Tax=Hymenobacter sp. YIM 151858-1 TaxID=2987688 RepID=UPI0022274F02|nr:ferritin-like domain-containing protein [Hymenobacter sp. YIM 151858-1]UYZ59030.1 ferritin-like domain-containing protein [Hymenobacter sp. YIM 151858-1]